MAAGEGQGGNVDVRSHAGAGPAQSQRGQGDRLPVARAVVARRERHQHTQVGLHIIRGVHPKVRHYPAAAHGSNMKLLSLLLHCARGALIIFCLILARCVRFIFPLFWQHGVLGRFLLAAPSR